LYNSKVSTEGLEKQTGGNPPEKFWFRSFVWLGENLKIEVKFCVEPEVSSLESANFHHFGRFICGIIWERSSQKIARAKNERRRGGWGRRAERE